jgi:hypothetical protein
MNNAIELGRQAAIASARPDVARAAHYDPLPEQIGRITKALAHLSAAGVDIGPDGLTQVDRAQAVKIRFPKARG